MRAQVVNLRVHGDAGHLIHLAAARGLLTTLSLGANHETCIDIIGPLALFHRTGVYGRALADLVPLLADCDRFHLDLLCRSRDGQLYPVSVASPVLLPAPPARLTLPDPRLVRLTKELARTAPDIATTPRPPPLAAGATLACPDLVLERAGRTLFVELIGFWTTAHLDKKLALYRAAGVAEVVFCIDESRGCTKDALPEALPTVRYSKHMTATANALADMLRR
jgi:predicted nuclease of restriction endonuclease-like RecB superfamily